MRKPTTLAFICLIIFTACAPVTPTAAPTPTKEPTATMAPTATSTPAPSPTMPSPTQTPDNRITDRETVIANATVLVEAFEEKLRITGWVRKVFPRVQYDNMKKDYWPPDVVEEWYRLEEDGALFVEGYNWITTDGAITQEVLFQDGFYYNITYGKSSPGELIHEAHFLIGILPTLQRGGKVMQEAVQYNGADAWKFTAESLDGGLSFVEAIYFDKNNGFYIGSETYVIQSDGSPLLVGSSLGTLWEIDAEPPLERFKEMRDRAAQQSP